MNFQDILHEVFDGDNKALKVVGNTNSTGSATVIPAQSWPDPKTYIGLVTVTGNFGTTGNVTLSDSKNYIGLVTSTPASSWPDPKSYIGLVTVTGNLTASLSGNITLNPSPNFIGIVTVANPNANSGNVTLDPGSKVSLIGNVTLSDPKNYIGLVTSTLTANFASTATSYVPGTTGLWTDINGNINSNINTLIAGEDLTNNVLRVSGVSLPTLYLADPKGYVGLVTVTQSSSTRSIVGNVTLSDAKTNIGLVTLSGGTAWTDPKGFIGLVTVVGSLSASSGNVTLNPSPNFIGLVTVANTVPVTLSGNATITLGTQIAGEDQVNNVLKIEGQFSYTNITSIATTVVKSGSGFLHGITVNTPVASTVITMYDNTAASGSKIGTITLPGTLVSQGPDTALYDVKFNTGLTITTSVAADLTVSYR